MTRCYGCDVKQPNPIYIGMGWKVFNHIYYEGSDEKFALTGTFCKECTAKIEDPDQFDEFAKLVKATRRMRGRAL